MADITMCRDKMCPMFHKCYRAQAIPNEYRQAYFLSSKVWDNGCKYYSPMSEETWPDLQEIKQGAEEGGLKLSSQTL